MCACCPLAFTQVQANLQACGFSQHAFDAVVSADKFNRNKPAPDIFLSAASLICVQAMNCIVVEDAVAGIQAAKAAGMKVIAVTTSLSTAEMEGQRPNLIKENIGQITMDDVLHL
eukprot:GHRR01024200.1.p1 GENE.GHRR01024200.1~~GHRR01024200.1.p1  ORF type:complete len:115 (+),score=13.84 GHRR01024200.1:121-465(+)